MSTEARIKYFKALTENKAKGKKAKKARIAAFEEYKKSIARKEDEK